MFRKILNLMRLPRRDAPRNDNFLAEAGSLMVEALAMLALISLVTPILYKKAAERTTELQDINSAGEIRGIVKAMDDYLKDNYSDIVDGNNVTRVAIDPDCDTVDYSAMHNPTPANAFEAEVGVDLCHLSEYLPYGFLDGTGNVKPSKLFSDYKMVVKKVDSGVGANKKVLTAFLIAEPKEGDKFPVLRASRIASMVGSNGGYAMEDNKASGVQGIWAIDDIDAELDVDDVKKGALIATSVQGVSAPGGDDTSDEYLHRTDSSHIEENNTMRTTLFMGKNPIHAIQQLVVEADGTNWATTDNENDALLLKRGGANIKGRILAAGEKFEVNEDKLSYRNMDSSSLGVHMEATDNSFKVIKESAGHASIIKMNNSSDGWGNSMQISDSRWLELNGPAVGANTSYITMKDQGGGPLTAIYAPRYLQITRGDYEDASSSDGGTIKMNTGQGIEVIDKQRVFLHGGSVANDQANLTLNNSGAAYLAADRNIKLEKTNASNDGSSIEMDESGNITGLSSSSIDFIAPFARIATPDSDPSFVAVQSDGSTSVLGMRGVDGVRIDASLADGSFKKALEIENDDAVLEVRGSGANIDKGNIDIIAGNKLTLKSKNFELAVSDDLKLSGDDGQAKLGLEKSNHRAIMRYDDAVKGTTGFVSAEPTGVYAQGHEVRIAGGTNNSSGRYTSAIYAQQNALTLDASASETDAHPARVVIENPNPNDNYAGQITIRKGTIEIGTDSASGSNKDDPRSYVKADRFLSNTDLQTAAIPQDMGTKKYDDYQVNPAYTSVMHDIKLTSRGGARLSDILPDFVNKGIYVVNNTYKETIHSGGQNWESGSSFKPVNGAVTQDMCGENDAGCATSPWLGFVPGPLCPPGYAFVITITPAGFDMAQAGKAYTYSGNRVDVKIQDKPHKVNIEDITDITAEYPLYAQKNTWMRSRVFAGKNSSGEFEGWHTIMGFVYPYLTFKSYIDHYDPGFAARTIGGDVTVNNAIAWNIFPVKQRTLEAYATVYCYFDRLDGAYNEWDVDKYNQLSTSAFREPKDYDKTTNYKGRLNDPRIGYDTPW